MVRDRARIRIVGLTVRHYRVKGAIKLTMMLCMRVKILFFRCLKYEKVYIYIYIISVGTSFNARIFAVSTRVQDYELGEG